MDKRFLLAFGAFVLIVGTGALWWFTKYLSRKKVTLNLLSLPKERRFFWFRLRDSGFEVTGYNVPVDFSVTIDGQRRDYTFELDFIARKKNKRYGCLFASSEDEKEMIKLFFTYASAADVHGIVFYDEWNRQFSVWER